MLQTSVSAIAILLAAAYCLYLLATARGKGTAHWALLAGLSASLGLEVSDLQGWLHPDVWMSWEKAGLLAASCLPGAWLLFSLTFSRAEGLVKISRLPSLLLLAAPAFPLAAALLPVESFYYSPDFALERLLFLGRPGFFFSIGIFVYLTCALVQLERTLLSLPRHIRWRVKFKIIGAGTLLTVYLVYFSQGMLHRSLDLSLLPARSFALAAAVLLMAFSSLRRGEQARIQISRTLAFRSVVVLAVGFYLIGLGLFGEGMRLLNPTSQRVLLVLAGLVGGIGMLVILLSETVQRKIKVSLHKNFYQDKYDYRDQWLRFTRRLAANRSQEDLHQEILAFFGETFAVQEVILLLREPEGDMYRTTAAHGTPAPSESFHRDNPLVRYFQEPGWIFARRDDNPEIWAENRPFLDRYGVSFVVPLHFDRILEGFLVLGRPINLREKYTYEDFDLMKLLAGQAIAAILSVRLADQLAGSRELAAIGKVSAFVLHDLKNHVSNLALVVENARHNLDDQEFRQDMLQTLAATVRRMNGLIARLQDLEEKTVLNRCSCDLSAVVREGARLAGNRNIVVSGGPVLASIDPEEIQKVVINLLHNALEAGCGRQVLAEVGNSEDCRVFFRVCDQGCGMSEEFIRKRLFRPFETTKKKGFGIGLYQCRHIVEAHGGSIEVKSSPGAGSEFTVWLPAGQLDTSGGPARVQDKFRLMSAGAAFYDRGDQVVE